MTKDYKTQLHYWLLDENKNLVPCDDVLKWGEMFEDFDNRCIARDDINGVVISTVFLGHDFEYETGMRDEPHPFGTLVQGGKHAGETNWKTYAEAVAGHNALVKKVKGE